MLDFSSSGDRRLLRPPRRMPKDVIKVHLEPNLKIDAELVAAEMEYIGDWRHFNAYRGHTAIYRTGIRATDMGAVGLIYVIFAATISHGRHLTAEEDAIIAGTFERMLVESAKAMAVKKQCSVASALVGIPPSMRYSLDEYISLHKL